MAPEAEARDPVCHQTIHPMAGYAHAEYQGKTYWFCDESCRKRFEKDPEKAVAADRQWVRQGGGPAREWVAVATVSGHDADRILTELTEEGIETRTEEVINAPSLLRIVLADGFVGGYSSVMLVPKEDAARAIDFLRRRGYLR